MSADTAALRTLLEPPVDALGYELLHLEYAAQNGRNILRVYIDAPGGIRVDDCEAVSRQLSALLDVEQPLSAAFDLEVSSPGIDRPLVKPEHFRRHTGSRARIVMHSRDGDAHAGGDSHAAQDSPPRARKNYTGELLEADEQRVVLRVDGERHELAYAHMRMARLAPESKPGFSASRARRPA